MQFVRDRNTAAQADRVARTGFDWSLSAPGHHFVGVHGEVVRQRPSTWPASPGHLSSPEAKLQQQLAVPSDLPVAHRIGGHERRIVDKHQECSLQKLSDLAHGRTGDSQEAERRKASTLASCSRTLDCLAPAAEDRLNSAGVV